MPARNDIQRFLGNRQDEIDSAAQYRAMADSEPDEGIAKIYRELADVEDKHVAFWEKQLAARGVDPGPRQPSWRARVLRWTAKHWGARVVLPTVTGREFASSVKYATQSEARATKMPAEERSHARVLTDLLKRDTGVAGSALARVEGRHRNVGSNALRAAVLGANDGLCSNLSLVMGVAGATQSGKAILVTGLAGLLAGASSMALGEWISVTSSRELSERELEVERDEVKHAPEEEQEELQLIYESKGIPKDEAQQMAEVVFRDQNAALDVMAREELGLDPGDMGGSPWTAAITSFVLFAIGAIFPVIPFMFTSGWTAVVTSVIVSALVLFGLGAAITVFTGRSALTGGLRQLTLGMAAAGLTYALGHLLGAAIT